MVRSVMLNTTVIRLDNKFVFYMNNNIYSYTFIFIDTDNHFINHFGELQAIVANNFWGSKTLRFFKSLSFLMQIKIKFTGKMYRIRKSDIGLGFLRAEFNRAHKTIFIPKDVRVKKLKKRKLIFISNHNDYLKKSSRDFLSIRSVNIFTKRGIRLSKQLLLKKAGKVSTYR